MNTTNLFVELIVVGVGGFLAIAIAICAVFGFDIAVIEKLSSTTALALPALAFVYLFGILFDRISNYVFDILILNSMRRKHYQDKKSTFYDDKNTVLFTSSKFSEMFEYNRSRQRICRGWALNSLLIIIATILFNATNPGAIADQGRLIGIMVLFFSLIGIVCIFSWYQLAKTEMLRIEDQAKSIREAQDKKKNNGQ